MLQRIQLLDQVKRKRGNSLEEVLELPAQEQVQL